MSADERVKAVTTGHPEVRLLACKVCGVVLWDIDAHYTHAHPNHAEADAPTPLNLDAIREMLADRPALGRSAALDLIHEVEWLRAATVKPDLEEVARAIFDADFPDIAEAERDAEWGIIASADHVSVWHRQADAVLALLPGRTEAEVKAEAWDEGYGTDEECGMPRTNPYRKEK